MCQSVAVNGILTVRVIAATLPPTAAPMRLPRRHAVSLLSLAVLAALSVPAAAQVKVDGVIEPAEWQGARHVTEFRMVQPFTQAATRHPTEAWILATPEGLAVAFRNTKIAGVETPRQRSARDQDVAIDRVNLMLDFDGDARGGYDFTVTASGGIQDFTITGGGNFSGDWDGLWQHAVVDGDGEWTAELLIPWHTAPMKKAAGDEERAFGLAGTIFLVSTLGWCAIAVYVYVYLHWNVVAYVALAPILFRLLGSRILLVLHLGWGLLLITVAMLNYTVTPVKLLGFGDTGAAAAHGWEQLAERVEAQKTTHPTAFLAATRYTYASQIGFVLGDNDVVAFNTVPSQTDYWWDPATYAGHDALIVADRVFKASEISDRFETLKRLERVDVVDVFGNRIWRFEIWLGRNFRPATP